MRIQVDNQEIFELLPWQENVIKNDIFEEEFETHMRRIARWVWENKFERCFERLKNEWEPKLIDRGLQSLPTGKEEFANLVFSQPDYRNRSERLADENSP